MQIFELRKRTTAGIRYSALRSGLVDSATIAQNQEISASMTQNRGISIPRSLRQRRAKDLPPPRAQAVLAEEDFVTDEESGRAEGAAVDGALRVREQPILDRRLLGHGDEARAVEAGLIERRARHRRIVHLLRLGPHVAEHGVDVAIEHAFRFR